MKYRFKCGITALALAVMLVPAAHAESGYKGGFVISDTSNGLDYKLKINGRVQVRGTFEAFDGDAPSTYAFSVPRGRIAFSGHVLTKRLTYKLHIAFDKGDSGLKDFYADYKLSDGFILKAGQFKKPFSRHFITSSSKLTLVERAITNSAFASGRDIGIMAHNGLDSGFQWAAAVLNGTGEKGVFAVSSSGSVSRSNVPDQLHPIGVFRAAFASEGFGKDAYSEGDVKCDTDDGEGCDVRWAVGASVQVDPSIPDDGDEGEIQAEVDVALKVSNFAFDGEFFIDNNLGDAGGIEAIGFRTEASYFIRSARLLPALRFAMVIPDDSAQATRQELSLGAGYLAFGNQIKWQTDVSMLTNELAGASSTDWRVRSQLQVSF